MTALRSSKFCLAPHGTGFGMRQFDAIAHGCVPLIVKVKWEEDPGNGGTLEQPYAEIIPWTALAFHLTRAQIPQLPALLAAVTPERHAMYRRAAACVWPRLFWMPLPTVARPDEVDSRVLPPKAKCGDACIGELRRMEPHDAFGTLMWLLEERLRARKAKAARITAGTEVAEAARPDGLFVAEETSTLWERTERSWEDGPMRLRTAKWRTPAASCERALAMEAGRGGGGGMRSSSSTSSREVSFGS